MKKNINPDQKTDALLSNIDTSASTQCKQMLTLLKIEGSLNTLEFRELGFMSPAQRVMNLKEQGHNIQSMRENVRTPDGRMHRGIARYYFSNTPPANETNSEVAA